MQPECSTLSGTRTPELATLPRSLEESASPRSVMGRLGARTRTETTREVDEIQSTEERFGQPSLRPVRALL